MNTLSAWIATKMTDLTSRVEIPAPHAPSSDDITKKGTQFGDWLASRGHAFYLIAVVLIITLIVVSLLKKPMVRGAVIGALLIIIAAVVMNHK